MMVEWLMGALAIAGVVALLVLPFLAMELIRLSRANEDLIERNGIQAMMLAGYRKGIDGHSG